MLEQCVFLRGDHYLHYCCTTLKLRLSVFQLTRYCVVYAFFDILQLETMPYNLDCLWHYPSYLAIMCMLTNGFLVAIMCMLTNGFLAVKTDVAENRTARELRGIQNGSPD